jgi:hypothetical protein
MTRYRSTRVVTTGEGAMTDEEAREMFGLPPKIEDEEAAEAARELLGPQPQPGLAAVPSGDGDGASDGEGSVDVTEEVSQAAE